jgi:hypothetical protein
VVTTQVDDDHLGALLAKLDDLGSADNTIVFYSTDKRPVRHYVGVQTTAISATYGVEIACEKSTLTEKGRDHQ